MTKPKELFFYKVSYKNPSPALAIAILRSIIFYRNLLSYDDKISHSYYG
ncbi:MAG TPA: hypothetical protein HPP56_05310 [Nitrospirae bacterium]|nr:hypothetical protein [Nitrospirota bacterium]